MLKLLKPFPNPKKNPLKYFLKQKYSRKLEQEGGVRGPKKIKIETGICKGSKMLS